MVWATYEKVAEDTAGIETAGVGKTDFLLNHCECVCDVICVYERSEKANNPMAQLDILEKIRR